MLGSCLIILSCYYSSFDSKKLYACAVNPAHILSVQLDDHDKDRYMIYMTGKYTRHATVKETPSQIKLLAHRCKGI